MVLGGKWSSTRSILVSSMNIHQRDSLTRVHARSKQSISRIAIIKLTASEVCRFSNGVTEHRFEILTMETPMTLKSSLSIGQSHWKWSRWVSRGWFPMVTDISLKLYVGVTRAMPKNRPSEVLPCEWCARTSQTDGRQQTELPWQWPSLLWNAWLKTIAFKSPVKQKHTEMAHTAQT